MRIGVISDLHLGFRQYGFIEREKDFYNQFKLICQKLNELNVDIVIIAGDLFNKPNPSPITISEYREGIGSLNADIVCTIKGNHTMILRDDHYSIDDFFGDEEIEGYFFLDDSSFSTQLYSISSNYDMEFRKYRNINIWIDGITYRTNSDMEEFFEVQKSLAKQRTDDSYNILVVHQSFKEFCGFVGEELSINDIDYSPYDLVICGHIHSRSEGVLDDGTLFLQPGSIERMNTTEALDEQENGKGVYVVETDDNSISFHPVECERKFFLGEIDINEKKDIEEFYEKLLKEVVKLNLPAIISYKFNNCGVDIKDLRDYILLKKKNVLIDNSHIYDKADVDEVMVEFSDSEVPIITEVLKKKAEENLDEYDTKFAIDLFSLFKENSEDIQDFLDDYLKKRVERNQKENENINLEITDEIEELEKYFNNL